MDAKWQLDPLVERSKSGSFRTTFSFCREKRPWLRLSSILKRALGFFLMERHQLVCLALWSSRYTRKLNRELDTLRYVNDQLVSKSRNGKIVVWNTQIDAPPHLEFTMKNQGILNCSCIIDIRYLGLFAIEIPLNERFKQSRWQNPCMWDIPWNNTLLLSRDGTAFVYTQTSPLNKTGPAMSIHEGGSRFALCWWGRGHLEVRCFLTLFKMRHCLAKP